MPATVHLVSFLDIFPVILFSYKCQSVSILYVNVCMFVCLFVCVCIHLYNNVNSLNFFKLTACKRINKKNIQKITKEDYRENAKEKHFHTERKRKKKKQRKTTTVTADNE